MMQWNVTMLKEITYVMNNRVQEKLNKLILNEVIRAKKTNIQNNINNVNEKNKNKQAKKIKS